MLTAPNLKPGQTPYDPSLNTLTQPTNQPNPHNPTPTPEEILNLTLVKDTLTTLHQEDDSHYATLSQRTAHDLHALIQDHQTFLNNQKNKYKNQFKTEQQKHLFTTITTPYFTWSINRAQSLYLTKIHQYRQETTQRQNTELLNRLLSPETLFDDQTQTNYRDIILHNLESLLDHLPTHEKKQLLDQASKTLYKKIIEKRLETDPTRLTPILSSPAVQRVLTPQELNNYKSAATQAIRTDTLKTTAQQWLDQETPEKSIPKLIKESTKTETEATQLANHYTQLKFNQNRKTVLANILNIMNVWTLIQQDNHKPESIPPWVTRTNPTLHAYLIKTLQTRTQQGGIPTKSDYQTILNTITNYNPNQTMATLTDETKLHTLITQCGGIDSDTFGVILRLLLGALDQDDANWIHAMQLAQTILANHYGETIPAQKINAILARYDATRRIHSARQDGKELDDIELKDLLDKLIAQNIQ